MSRYLSRAIYCDGEHKPNSEWIHEIRNPNRINNEQNYFWTDFDHASIRKDHPTATIL